MQGKDIIPNQTRLVVVHVQRIGCQRMSPRGPWTENPQRRWKVEKLKVKGRDLQGNLTTLSKKLRNRRFILLTVKLFTNDELLSARYFSIPIPIRSIFFLFKKNQITYFKCSDPILSLFLPRSNLIPKGYLRTIHFKTNIST